MTRRTLAILLLLVSVCIFIAVPVLAFTPVGASFFGVGTIEATPTLPVVAFTLLPKSKPQAVFVVKGAPPPIGATEALLMDNDSGDILYDLHGETAVPMASTTKIMTAIIALQSGKLDQVVTIQQDAFNEWSQNNGSNAQLVVGDKLTLKELLYALLLPSGDDAAIAIADALAGSPANFVTIMNTYAYRLHLFSTHYINPDGLTYYDANHIPLPGHYTTAYDLVRLARYAMTIPLFAQIVQTQKFVLPASGQHHAYTWATTNDLLAGYKGANGVKTGHTIEAGYCLVFAATRGGHHLIGVVLNEGSIAQRLKDVEGMLNWGFGLPVAQRL